MRRSFVLLVLGVMLAVPFVLGYRISRGDRATSPVAMPGVVDEVRAALADQYYRPVPSSVLQLGSVDRIISALGDPYTSYLGPVDYSLLRQQTESRYSGIGVSVLPAAGGLVIVSLRPGPARHAGVRVGDTIVSIDGVSARHLDMTSARARILGPTNSHVHLVLLRGSKPVDVNVRRGIVRAPVVESSLLSYAGRRWGDLQLPAFRTGAAAALRSQIHALTLRGATGLVLDLRQNPGGFLDQAVAVSSLFLDRGVVVSLAGAHSPREVYRARSHRAATRLPLVVLVDRYSASSAEIVAAALQDNQRATLVGERTFGKGLVQTIDPLDNGAALELTIARYTTPAGKDISGVGIVPAVHAVDNPATARDEALETALRVLARPTS
jgi:carboxyl-terminal processing protease